MFEGEAALGLYCDALDFLGVHSELGLGLFPCEDAPLPVHLSLRHVNVVLLTEFGPLPSQEATEVIQAFKRLSVLLGADEEAIE